MLGSYKLIPLFIKLRLLGLYIQVYGLASQFFGLLIQQEHSWYVFFSSHPFSFDEFHVPFIVIVLLVSDQNVLNRLDVVNIHFGVVVDVQTKLFSELQNDSRVVFHHLPDFSATDWIESRVVQVKW